MKKKQFKKCNFHGKEIMLSMNILIYQYTYSIKVRIGLKRLNYYNELAINSTKIYTYDY